MKTLIMIIMLTIFAAGLSFHTEGGEPKPIEINQTQAEEKAVNYWAAGDSAAALAIYPQIVANVRAQEKIRKEEEQRKKQTQEVSHGIKYANLYPCGGDLPPCEVVQHESGGDYGAVNRTGCGGRSCGGKYQFDPNTWNNYGGYQYAQDAPPEVQDAKAREVWANGAGCSHWAAC